MRPILAQSCGLGRPPRRKPVGIKALWAARAEPARLIGLGALADADAVSLSDRATLTHQTQPIGAVRTLLPTAAGVEDRMFGLADAPPVRPERTKRPVDPGVAGELALLDPQRSFTHRCALAIGGINDLDSATPADWLREAASLLADACEGQTIEVWSARMLAPTRRWRTDHAAVAGGFNERIERALVELTARDCPLNEMPASLPTMGPWLRPRREIVPDEVWRESERRRVRLALGIDEFVQAGFRHQSGAIDRALVVQAGARAGEQSPERAGEALGAVAPFLFRAFHRRFIALEALRTSLLAVLRPAERALPDLLVQGLSERETGERIGRSRHTVHEKVRSIYKAWGVTSRFEMVEVWNGKRPAVLTPPGGSITPSRR